MAQGTPKSGAKSKSAKSNEIVFETALSELETIVERLEGESVSIDEAFALFERGAALAQVCRKKLAVYERKVQIVKTNGTLAAFDDEKE